jgi:hypothetical protein
MKVLSASQAISPAVERTVRFLFRPFEWATYLKLAAVACITEGFSANLSSSHQQSSWPGSGGACSPFHVSNELITLIALAVLVCFAIGIFVFYLVTRLRFAFFHCLVRQTREIRPGWRLYRAQALRFFKTSLLIWLLLLCIAVAVMLPFGFKFFDLYRETCGGGQFDLAGFFLLLLAFIPVVLLLSLALWAVKVMLHDFMLPHVALDDASVEEAWAAARGRIEAEKGKFFVYLLLRLLLPPVAGIALFLVLAIPLLIVFGILAVAAVGFHALLADATGVGAVVRIICEVLVGIVGVSLGLLVAFSLGGPIATWIRNYALLFYGGRYQALGDLLDPPPPPPPPADPWTPEVA